MDWYEEEAARLAREGDGPREGESESERNARRSRYNEESARRWEEGADDRKIDGGTNRQYDSADVAPDGTVTYSRVDPVTGKTQTSTADGSPGQGFGPRGDIRARRRYDRRAHDDGEVLRQEFFGEQAREGIDGVDDPWNELAGNRPTVDQLAGGDLTSELGGARADEASVAAQRAALQQMQQLQGRVGQISEKGYTAEEAAQMQRSRAQAAGYEQQQRDAIMQQASMRGMQGAGTTMAAQLAAQQGGANRMSQDALDTQAMAQRRALQAMQMQGQMQGQAGQLAGQMRGQGFGEETTRRSAVDDFNRYNTDKRRGAYRDRFGMDAGVAQGQSGAAQSRADHYREMYTGQKASRDSEKDKKKYAASDAITGII